MKGSYLHWKDRFGAGPQVHRQLRKENPSTAIPIWVKKQIPNQKSSEPYTTDVKARDFTMS
ncbi:hypothetical protein EYF80_019773 [Liparis tanakae]|uniref:Uncharacterized protein n=1 Tax=Liparis tanakae TaxID=230148 RepID=A0A4Z2HWM2_9TELE|nr:hypothetical protein EYF80_019773 [Liparis tanakae]